MCTVSWFTSSDGFELFSNRDERRTRGREIAPREYELDGVRYLAPRDSEAGGTWITVNEFGVALCVLNHYQAKDRVAPDAAKSRGLLVRALADCESIDELAARTPTDEIACYRGFRLIGLEPGRAPLLVEWDGEQRLETAGVDAPLISSSVDPLDARAARLGAFSGVASTTDAHLAFHASHANGPGPLSVCMHRSDAETRSLTHVVVRGCGVALRHAAGSPCVTPLGADLRLERRAHYSVGN